MDIIFAVLTLHRSGWRLFLWLSASLDRLANMHYMCTDGVVDVMSHWGILLVGIYATLLNMAFLISLPILGVGLGMITGLCWMWVSHMLQTI
jgi:hypothetical protein